MRWLERVVGGLSIGAGAIHGGVSPSHFEEFWGYGVFFLAASTAQVVLGLALLTQALQPRYLGMARFVRLRNLMYALGIGGNLAILALYAVTRTAGIPLGPGAGSVETVGIADAATGAFEVFVVAGLGILWMRNAKPALS